MDFEEWFKKRHTKTGLYEKSLCGDSDSLYLKHEMKKAFTLGQQSKQAEINVLQEKISKVLYAIAQSELHGDRAIWGIQDEIKEILK